MTGHGEKYSRKQDEAVLALITHPSIPEAAKSLNIGDKTLWRWMQKDDFQDAYLKARREIIKQASSQLQASMSEAVNVLKEVMNDNDSPASTRVSAAKIVLDMGLKANEIEDLEARVKKLEERGRNRR